MSKPEPKPTCESFHHVVRNIPDPEHNGRKYTDAYFWCDINKKRIQKQACINCPDYKPLK